MPKGSLLCTFSLLEGGSYQWWETLINVTLEELVDRDFFLENFKERYVNHIYVEQMKKEFLYLK